MTRTTARAMTAAALIASLAGQAWAQDALGTGRELESSLYQPQNSQLSTRGQLLDGSLRINNAYNPARPDFGTEIAFRNAVATGNAPGGLSFRGDVGYSAPFEFRGELGSDDLFAFRRDSLYSGLAGMGIRGTEAVQYQFSLTTGSRVPRGLIGSLVVPRDPAGQAVSGQAGAQRAQTQAPIARPDISADDIEGGLYSQLRATSAYTANRGYVPYLVATVPGQEEGQRLGVEASTLRGLKYDTFAADEARARARAEAEAAQARIDPLRPDSTLDTSASAQPERVTTAYDEVMRRLRERAGDDTDPAQRSPEAPPPEWLQRLEELRGDLLLDEQPGAQGAEGAENAQDAEGAGDTPGVPGQATPGTDQGAGDEPGAARAGAVSVTFDAETMQLLRDNGEPLGDLVDPEVVSRDPYVVHMRAGQKLLTAGRYFGAEERFTRALSVRPQDPTAQIGRVHSQLGAGLVLSAGLNLRSLLIGAPTLAPTRFSPELLPERERIEALKTGLRENIGAVERPGNRLALDPHVVHDSGLLLAYLGFQTDDEAAVRDGLGAFMGGADGQTVGSRVDLRLGRLLEAQWLPEGGVSGGAPDGE